MYNVIWLLFSRSDPSTENDIVQSTTEADGAYNNSNTSSRHGSIDTGQNSGNIDGLHKTDSISLMN